MKGGKAGSFRAAFEDKVLLSDLIFLRAWLAVDLPRFYNPVTNLLAPAPARRTRAPQVASPPQPCWMEDCCCPVLEAWWGEPGRMKAVLAEHHSGG